MELLLDLALPRTDAGVLMQFIAAGLILAVALWRFWSKTDARLVVIGVGLIVLGLMGFRSLH